MRRLMTALMITAITAPILAACVIIDTHRPTTRVIQTAPAEND
jgi:hypothetical protein